MNNPAHAIDLESYLRVACRMHPTTRGLAILDEHGDALNVSSPDVATLLSAVTGKGKSLVPRDGKVRYVALNQQTRALAVALDDGLPPARSLCLLVDQDERSPGPFQPALLLREGVRRELALNQELDAMSAELADRYEELNLVYHADDQVDYFREGKKALQDLVDNCVGFLNVSAAVLVLREKRLHAANVASLAPGDAEIVQKLAAHGVYDAVLRSGDAVVVNESAASGKLPELGLPLRILACPVKGSDGRIDGVLLLASTMDRHSFTNGDRNLLNVMAKRVAKTIQNSYDSLSGLLSRMSFEYLLGTSVTALRVDDREGCLLQVNVDHLHRINDTLGLEVGDRVIRATADQITRETHSDAILGRIGGDEFAVFVPDCCVRDGVALAERLRIAVAAARLEANGEIVQWTISVGVTCARVGAAELDDLMQRAAMSCTTAGEMGGNRVQSYESSDTAVLKREEHVWMIGRVHRALRENRFRLFGQAIYPFSAGRAPHVEVLLRMTGEQDEVIPPAKFLPACERYRLMMDIDRWVVEHALDMLAARADLANTVVAINLSGQSIGEKAFLADLLAMLRNCRIPRNSICLEITETVAVANLVKARRFMERLLEEGVRFALDDFGVGMSSFGYLRELPVQYLKIDGSLVRTIAKDPIAAAMVASINQIGHLMKLETIAEYVEDRDIFEHLKSIGVDFGQGYAIAKPKPLDKALDGLASVGQVLSA